ncbi:hypothetical protein HU200_063810 [Digitaria exilis]|uniref:KANL2-like probable zinc-finger domain-containing protein n=1 Tax=Digitaria exilis TaxID=1010633 RepID=A0A835AAN5_9POAL|nr:hypothetical protein HU200_063810 [Digitaria exilis]
MAFGSAQACDIGAWEATQRGTRSCSGAREAVVEQAPVTVGHGKLCRGAWELCPSQLRRVVGAVPESTAAGPGELCPSCRRRDEGSSTQAACGGTRGALPRPMLLEGRRFRATVRMETRLQESIPFPPYPTSEETQPESRTRPHEFPRSMASPQNPDGPAAPASHPSPTAEPPEDLAPNPRIAPGGPPSPEMEATAEALTREEVVRRRRRRAARLAGVYRRLYWAMAEEYVWDLARSPLEAEQPPPPTGAPVPTVGEPPRAAPVPRRKKCGFTGCKVRAMATTRFCHSHILSDPKQLLYKPCAYITKSLTSPPLTFQGGRRRHCRITREVDGTRTQEPKSSQIPLLDGQRSERRIAHAKAGRQEATLISVHADEA